MLVYHKYLSLPHLVGVGLGGWGWEGGAGGWGWEGGARRVGHGGWS